MNIFSTIDWIAFFWFLACWGGYTFFANSKSVKGKNLSHSLTDLRSLWMQAMLTREVKIADMTSLVALQRTVTFFASTTIFILAGLLAVLGASDKALRLAQAIPFVAEHSQSLWEIKILFMIFIFVYAFFKFTWAVRQYNFSLVMVGAAPEKGDKNETIYIKNTNDLLSLANKSFNYGLRAYTFSMATIAWFINPLLFIFATAWVVAILYRREFRSKTLAAMNTVIDSYKK
ncbi:MAG: DUF599 domain-containing protein [Kangiellaceae bacterium]|nr:DUF599 domain-containing protein [Kangiellaceae bacterium]